MLLTLAAFSGALLPDAGIFAMWGVAKSQGVAESVIWSDWYYSPYWQLIGALSNSLPLYLMLAAVSWWAGARFDLGYTHENVAKPAAPGGIGKLAYFMLVLSSAAILHVLADLPLHHDDGHPHFWPFTYWIYSSPVSYWDPAHYGRIWSVVELLIAMLLITVIWRRYQSRLTKFVLVLVGISYLAASAYWMSAF